MPIPNRGHLAADPSDSEARPEAGVLPPLELRILAAPSAGPRDLRCWLAGIAGVFVLTWLWAPYLREGPVYHSVVPALRPYYDRAVAGDAGAMRVLGDMYCQGLNVPRDTAEGLRWLRRAAAAGNADAVLDLERIGQSP